MSIILNGNPVRKSSHNFAEKFMYSAFVVAPLVLLGGAVLMFIIYLFVKDGGFFRIFADIFHTRVGYFFEDGSTFASVFRDNPLEYCFRMGGMAIILFVGSFFGDLCCDHCGHFFTQKRISDYDLVKSTERNVSQTVTNYDTAYTFAPSGRTYVTNIFSRGTQHGTETTDHYIYNARCSCCGCVMRKQSSRTYTNWQ